MTVRALVLLLTASVAAAQDAPSIAADGTDITFNWGDRQSITVQQLVDKLDACTKAVEALQTSQGALLSEEGLDATKTTNEVAIGKMGLTDVLRLGVSINGCQAKAAAPFSVVLTGNPSGGASSKTDRLDAFVTTSAPEAFSDGQTSISSIAGGGYQFYYRDDGSGTTLNVYLGLGGMAGEGCSSAAYKISVQSNQGTFDPAPASSSTQTFPARLHLVADGNSVDLAISDIVNPIAKNLDAGLTEAKSAIATANDAAGTNAAAISSNQQSAQANADGLKAVRAAVQTIEDAVDGLSTSKNCQDLEHDFVGGTVKGLPFPGSTLTFACGAQRFLNGAAKLTCNGATGEYDNDAPTCQKCGTDCLACSDADTCLKCGKDAQTGDQLVLEDGECGPEPCEVGVQQYNRLLNIMPTVGSECYGPRLNKKALTDGKYQPQANGRFVDGGYYHSCASSRPETAAVALKTATRIRTVRLWRRCDCCAAQNAGTFVQAKNVKTGKWEACGRIVSAEEGRCLGNDPAKEFIERDCGGMMASDVRLYKEGSNYLIAMELEAYSC